MSRIVSPRREFLRFLAASPLISPLVTRAWGQETSDTGPIPHPLISSAKDALDVMDFEPLAYKTLPPAHWGYMATGVDDNVTLRTNRQAFEVNPSQTNAALLHTPARVTGRGALGVELRF